MTQIQNIQQLRQQVDYIDDELLQLLKKRGNIVQQIAQIKQKEKLPIQDIEREQQKLTKLVNQHIEPYSKEQIVSLYRLILNQSIDLQNSINGASSDTNSLKVYRTHSQHNTKVRVGDVVFGEEPVYIFGPCAVEDEQQMDTVANVMSQKGLKIIRGGAYKPRTSPYDFQGLGVRGLEILKSVGEKYNLATISEVVDASQVEVAANYLDMFQVGARNMQNFELLKAIGRTNKPVLLKRGLSATVDEFLHAAEYILNEGNPNVVLCERGIRTYERATRNTLDISSVPIIKRLSHLPIIVDITHSTGRKDIMQEIAKASIAVGSHGLMCEVHPNPPIALSDKNQQLNIDEFKSLYDVIC